MQREAPPQSLSNTHCAVCGCTSSVQIPPAHTWPVGQPTSVQVAWQPPFEQTRPAPHCEFVEHSASVAVPQVMVPSVRQRLPAQVSPAAQSVFAAQPARQTPDAQISGEPQSLSATQLCVGTREFGGTFDDGGFC